MAERLDGAVLLAGCDKSLPGMLMAVPRLDVGVIAAPAARCSRTTVL
jgi:dihydroxyacid dehydratase/phosphogluconate dehydratase